MSLTGSCNICLRSKLRLLNLSVDNKFKETYQLIQLLADPQQKLGISLWICSTCWIILRKIAEFQQKIRKSQKYIESESSKNSDRPKSNENANAAVSTSCKKDVETNFSYYGTESLGSVDNDEDTSQAADNTNIKSEYYPVQFLKASLDENAVDGNDKSNGCSDDTDFESNQNEDIVQSDSDLDGDKDTDDDNKPSSSTTEKNVPSKRRGRAKSASDSRMLRKRFKCRRCDTVYKDAALLRRHKCPNLAKNSKKCPFCGNVFKNDRAYLLHVRSHTGEARFKCKFCDRVVLSKSQLVDHERIHTGEKPHVCQFCGRGFRQQGTLNTHMKLHTGPPNQCNICDKRFCREVDLQNHIQRIHLGQRPEKTLLCPTCGYATNDRWALNQHMETHSEERKYDCKQCGKCFKQKTILQSHMLTHSDDKPHQCSVCSYRCNRKSNLKIHMKKHVNEAARLAKNKGEQLYTCEYCSKPFSVQEELLEHIRSSHAKLD